MQFFQGDYRIITNSDPLREIVAAVSRILDERSRHLNI